MGIQSEDLRISPSQAVQLLGVVGLLATGRLALVGAESDNAYETLRDISAEVALQLGGKPEKP